MSDNSKEGQNSIQSKIIDNAFQYGSTILCEGIKAISHIITKSKDLEIEKLKQINAMMENKKRENENKTKMLELELNKEENDYLNNNIITYNYEKESLNKEEMIKIINNFKNELSIIIEKLKINENFIRKIKEKILNLIREKKQLLKESKRMNIYIMGVTGVGKSCLKNSICKKNEAKEQIGKRGTTERFTYICDCHNFLSITDNLGIELSESYGIDNIKEDTKEFIMEKIKSNDEAIHCIWYCITGTRLQDSEYNLICDLRKLYQNNNIPIIIVYTQAINDENINDMKNYLNEEIKKNNNEQLGEEPKNIQFIPILAKPNKNLKKYEIKPYNISKLIEKTFKCFTYSVNLANKKSLIELIISQIKDDYEIIYNNSLESIKTKDNSDEKYFIIFIKTLINDFLSFNFENEQFLNLNSIKDSIISYINENYEIFKSKKVLSLISEMIKIEREFCIQNSNEDINLSSFIKTEQQFKEIIEIKINEKNIEQYKKHYFNEICKELFKILLSEVKTNTLSFIETIMENDKSIQNEIDSSIQLNQTDISDGVNRLIKEIKEKEK